MSLDIPQTTCNDRGGTCTCIQDKHFSILCDWPFGFDLDNYEGHHAVGIIVKGHLFFTIS